MCFASFIEPILISTITMTSLYAKSCNFTFTLNNYTDDHIDMLTQHDCRAMGYGKEVSKTGTPHLQGWLCYPNQRSLNTVRKRLAGAHVEVMKRRLQYNREYCMKDGDYTERGDIPKSCKDKGKMEKDRWSRNLMLAKSGHVDEMDADMQLRFHATIKKLAAQHAPKPVANDKLDNSWYYGPSGTGKSMRAREDNPGAYIKLNNKWWDGYEGEDVVIIDDFDKYDIGLSGHLKRWSDHYPFPAEYKGGVKLIRPKRIIVTSNYAPEEIWEDEATLGPIRRRFNCIHFNEPFKKK